MTDLWPEEIEQPSITVPIKILKQQGSLLSKKTNNIVEGEVYSLEGHPLIRTAFMYNFCLSAPALNGYTYALFDLGYDIEMYPIYLRTEQEILNEIRSSLPTSTIVSTLDILHIFSESEFLDVLSLIFKSQKTIRIIKALIAQSRG